MVTRKQRKFATAKAAAALVNEERARQQALIEQHQREEEARLRRERVERAHRAALLHDRAQQDKIIKKVARETKLVTVKRKRVR